MSSFYTYFGYGWDEVLVSGYENGKKFNRKIPYQPFLFSPVKDDDAEFRTVKGKPLRKKKFESIRAARDFLKRYEGVERPPVYGLTNYPYVYIYENFKDMVSEYALMRIGNIDIETDSQNGYGRFTIDRTPDREVVSITMKVFGDKNIYVLGLKPYTTREKELIDAGWKINYKKCMDERELLLAFIAIWRKLAFDVITNWNGEQFDIPYLVKRIQLVLSEEHAKKLSPFNKIEKSEFTQWGKTIDTYNIVGVPCIDYMQAYKKFSFGNEESYKLEYIASKVLKLGKLDYGQYKTLARLYRENHDMFIDYNIIDVLRVEQLDDFLKFLPQIVMLAHFAKVNFVDTFGTIRTWDIMIHNYLMDRNIAVPQAGSNSKERQIAGGFVKQPTAGYYPYVMSFDLTSLYPHLVMMYNISPETLLGSFDAIAGEYSVDKILQGEMKQYHAELVESNVTVSGKGTVFSKDHIGFLPQLMKNLFIQRKEYKIKMLQQEEYLQEIKAELAKRGLNG